jgi:hypothetical protein
MIVGRTLPSRLACAAALLIAASPAVAQYGSAPAPPPQVPRSNAQSSADAPAAPATPAELHAAAACLIARNAAAGDAMLATAPYSSEERQQAVRLLGEMQRCLHQRQPLSTSAVMIRGTLAETVYETRFTTPQAARAPALAVKPLLQPDRLTSGTNAAELAPSYALAECTAAQHPELVIGLLQAEPLSAASQAAFQAINPAFVACVAPGTTQLSVDGRTIRGILAEDLYRWSVVQRDGPASPWAAPPAAPAAAAAH